MKTRNGFVSNSSSASFVIPLERVTHHGNNEITREVLLSQEEIDLLTNYGFWKSCNRDPFRESSEYGYRCDDCNGNKDKSVCSGKVFGDMYLRYDISCNEDEPIHFLLEHDIPFYAEMDYSCQLMVYKKGMKKVLILQNEGIKYIWGMMGTKSDKYFTRKKYNYTCDSDQCFDEYKTIKYVNKKDAPGA
jgi:hypothetical protein